MQTIKLDIIKRDIMPTIVAKQGDVGRRVRFIISDGGECFYIPSDVTVCLWYSGSSGQGSYTSIGGRSAFTVDEDTVELELIPVMLQNAGGGTMCLTIYYPDGTVLGTWNLLYISEAIPGADGTEAVAYYTAFSELVQKAMEAAAAFTPDESLSVSGQPADAKAVGDALEHLNLSNFGIGAQIFGNTQQITDLNNHRLGTGYYYCTATAENGPEGFGGGPLYVLNWLDGSVCMQVLMNNILSQTFVRRYEDGVWKPWCYLNPSMMARQIYRTAEVWNGKPVYALRLHFNGLANSTEVYTAIGLNTTNAPNLTLIADDFSYRTANSIHQYCNSPIATGQLMHYIYKSGTEWRYGVTSNFDASTYTADATIKFVHDGATV